METIYNIMPNYGYLEFKFDELQLKPIKNEIEEIQNENFTRKRAHVSLVSNIANEYVLPKCHDYVEKLLMPHAIDYYKNSGLWQSNLTTNNDEVNTNIKMTPLWVNFQKKYEFNPPHMHSGVLSFVIWIDIPYKIEDEQYTKTDNYVSIEPGCFSFLYNDILGKIQKHLIPADHTYNNTMILFPAGLNHCVYPFYTSDSYRISVAGNFALSA
jgi:hypothetical protein